MCETYEEYRVDVGEEADVCVFTMGKDGEWASVFDMDDGDRRIRRTLWRVSD
jgi:hypothetical protein